MKKKTKKASLDSVMQNESNYDATGVLKTQL